LLNLSAGATVLSLQAPYRADVVARRYAIVCLSARSVGAWSSRLISQLVVTECCLRSSDPLHRSVHGGSTTTRTSRITSVHSVVDPPTLLSRQPPRTLSRHRFSLSLHNSYTVHSPPLLPLI